MSNTFFLYVNGVRFDGLMMDMLTLQETKWHGYSVRLNNIGHKTVMMI